MSNRATSGGSNVSNAGAASRAQQQQPSVAGFYDWSSSITGCVQVSQYHQSDQQQQHHQYYYQHQQHQRQDQQQQQQAEASGGSAQVFPVRRPSKATLVKMRQYYNPGMKLLQAGRPADAAWREAGQPTKGERHLALARAAAGRQAQLLLDEPPAEPLQALPVAATASRTRLDSGGGQGQCQCSYDPRLYPVYTSRSQGPMCVVCKLRRPPQRHRNHRGRHQSDWTEAGAAEEAMTLEALGAGEERLLAPPSTPRPAAATAGRATALSSSSVVAVREDGRRATLDVFLPNAGREPASQLPRPSCCSCDSARSQRTLSSPEPPLAPEQPPPR